MQLSRGGDDGGDVEYDRVPVAWPQSMTVEEERAILTDVLSAYSALDDGVGYCQGMNFVAAVLLRHMPKEVCVFPPVWRCRCFGFVSAAFVVCTGPEAFLLASVVLLR